MNADYGLRASECGVARASRPCVGGMIRTGGTPVPLFGKEPIHA